KSVSMKLSGCTGQPGTQTIGKPAFDRQSQPRKSGNPMQPVTLFSMAWTPPYAAHVPAATTPHALGARRSIQSHVRIGWPDASRPKPAQQPSGLVFSLGTGPSTTRGNGPTGQSCAL